MTRPLRMAAVLAALVVGWLLAPTSIGGAQTYLTTYGTSMEPGFHAGDLGVLRAAGDYAVGDVVGYRSATLAAIVLHRIVARDGDAFVLKGDHNPWQDVDRPTARDVVGRLVLRVPQAGRWLGWVGWLGWLGWVTAAAGALGLAVLLGSRSGAGRRQGRAERRHRGSSAVRARLAVLRSPSEGQAAGLTGGAALVGLGAVLLVLAAAGPLTRPAARPNLAPRTMTFSYTATVPGTAAFDGTTISSPDPVFRRLASTVTVHYAYRGDPGAIRLTAELRGQSGWHSTVPLPPAGQAPSSRPSSDGEVQLDLAALDRRAGAATAATGSSDEQVGLRIVATVSPPGGRDFVAPLALVLTRQQLSVPDPRSLVVVDAGAGGGAEPAARAGAARAAGSISVLGRDVGVRLARRLAQLLIALGALLAAGAAGDVLLARPVDRLAAVRRRYGRLLVPTGPVDPPPGHPVVDLVDAATLARLARSYGLPVMHWQGDGAAVFAVWHDAALYRYRLPTRVLPPPRGVSRRRVRPGGGAAERLVRHAAP